VDHTESSANLIDPAEVQRTLEVFHPPGSVFEIRILGARGVTSGYFNDPAKAVTALERLSPNLVRHASGIYFTPNPVVPAVFDEPVNGFPRGKQATANTDIDRRRPVNGFEPVKQTTADGDIERRRWLLIDFDPVRPSWVSTTDEEHSAALARSWECRKFLTDTGFGDPVHANSGNGAHLSYRIDLPNDDESRALIRRFLAFLDSQFSDDAVKVDKKLFNASRIWKLYWNCPGLMDTPKSAK
jgi:hypothetical protein